MADYWKSQPRKFCQYCKCWIADNKPSIEFHERGKNHKENVAAKISEIKKKSVEKAKQEKKMCKQFAAMEEAAMKAYEEDLKRMEMEARGLSVPDPAPAPAPVPPRPPANPQPKKKQKKKEEKAKLAAPAAAAVWVEGLTDEGNVYYYNTATGESRWEEPEGFRGSAHYEAAAAVATAAGSAWMEAVSPDGYTYYYNTESGESSWEKPAGFSSGEELLPPGTLPETEAGAVDKAPASLEAVDQQHDQQHGVPRINFRKRKAEDPGREEEEEEGVGGGGGGGGGEEEAAVSADTTTEEETRDETETKTEGEEEQRGRLEPEPGLGSEPGPGSGAGPGPEPGPGSGPAPAPEPGPGSLPEPGVKIRVRRPRTSNPYGTWEKITEEKDPYADVDLQLPQVEESSSAAAVDLPPEPKPKFKERVITSLGDDGGGEPATFRRNRTQNGKSRRIRQRDEED